MKALLKFTLAQTVLFNVVFVLLMVVGAYAILAVPVERYPAVKMGQVSIQAFYPGASPQEVEALVTREIEDALENLDNLDFIKSTSNRERCRIVVKFKDDTDYDAGFDDLRLKVLSIQKELPAAVDPPQFNFIDADDLYPVVSVNLSGHRDNRSLVLMAEDVKTQLRQIPGVKEIKLWGEFTREYHIELDPDRLSAYGLTFDQVANALQAANIAIPAGDLDTANGEYVIVIDEQFRTRDQIAATVVRRDGDGSFVTMAEIMSDAKMAHRDPVIISSVNGKPCVTLEVVKTWDGNALDILTGVKRVTAAFQKELADEQVALVMTQDSTISINDAIRTLGLNLFLGIVLVCFVIWWFMGFRNAALTTIGIPFAFLVTMVFMYLSDYSLNEITLFSFVLISGIVVDDAIVIIENIYRHLQMGKSIDQAIVDGGAEVFLPIVSATLTTVAAFLPMLIMTGFTGEFFAQIPKAVAFALLASVLECLFILPIHYKDFGPRPKLGKEDNSAEPSRIGYLRKPVARLMTLALRFRWTTLSLLAVAFAIATTIAVLSLSGKVPLIKVKFFPEDYGRYYVELEAPDGTSIEKTSAQVKHLSAEIVKLGPHIAESAAGFAGFVIDEDYEPIFNGHLGHVVVTLPPQSLRRFPDDPSGDPEAHLDWMRHHLKPFLAEGFQLRVRPQPDGPPTGKDVNVRAVGSDERSVYALADRLKLFLSQSEGLKGQLEDLQDDRGQENKAFHFQVRRERASEFGVTPAQVASLTAAALNGRIIGEFRDRDEQVDLKLKLTPMASPEQALQVPLLEHPSGPVLLGDLNLTSIEREPGYLNRYQGERAVSLTANLAAGSTLSTVAVVNRVQAFYREIRGQYPGASLSFAGEYEDTRRSFASLGYAFIIAFLLIYMILATQFQSYVQPLIVLSTIVFAFIGVIMGLFVSRSVLTINNLIAMVGVVGVVVNDSLVLIEFINKLYRSGMSRREAILKGTQIRLRPILLTTLTTSLAFLPMALGIPEYSLTWGSMASTFVTGLCTATFLTLFIVPVQWDLIAHFTEWLQARKKARLA